MYSHLEGHESMSACATLRLWNPSAVSTTPATTKPLRAVDRLSGVQVDAETGMHVGTLQVGDQRLRVGIRPAAVGTNALPLLVCNGIGANLELAAPMMTRLERIETVIFDVPGAGKSPPPKRPYRLFELARLTRRVLDQLGYEQVDLMGVSWGGGLAQQFAIQYPARVRRLVLAATAMGGMTMLPGDPRTLLKMIDPRRYLDKGYMKRVAPQLYGGELRGNPDAIKLFTDHARGGDARGYRYQLLAMLGWTSLPWLWRIRHPTLVLAGNDDPLVPLVNARLMTRLLQNAKLQVFDDGHLFLLTRAAQTAQAIGTFLQES
jgi:poly(3-hydroxyalkanoate) depolymerase